MTLQQDWEELARLDPLWAILSYRDKRFGRWDLRQFFATGDRQVRGHLDHAAELGYPGDHRAVLDFGCGVGRLAPALSTGFETYCGVDISERMVAHARHLHASRPNCTFLVSSDDALQGMADASFDLVFTLYVLQHLPAPRSIVAYLRSFLRVLRPGGLLLFQLPARIPPLEKLAYDSRRVLYLGLRGAGASSRLLHRYLGLSPMVMNHLHESEVLAVLAAQGGMVVDIERVRGGIAIDDRTYYVTRSG